MMATMTNWRATAALLALLSWTTALSAVAAATLQQKPAFLKTCLTADPDFPRCSRESVQGLFDQLSVGLPEIGILPLDPLNVTEVRIFQGEGPVSVNAKLSNVRIVGFSGARIDANVVDPRTYSFVTSLRIPALRIDGNYSLRGRVLLLPLQGHGTCWFEPRNLNVTSSQKLVVVYREGKRFFDLKDVHVDFTLGGLKMRMNNLFDGIRALEESTNTYINANWRPVAESLHPILVKTIEDLLYVVLKQLFDNVPADFFVGDIQDQGQAGVAKNIVARQSGNQALQALGKHGPPSDATRPTRRPPA